MCVVHVYALGFVNNIITKQKEYVARQPFEMRPDLPCMHTEGRKCILYVPSPAVLEPDLHLPGPQLELDSQGLLLLLQGKKRRIFQSH
jgi:hypothetical protein